MRMPMTAVDQLQLAREMGHELSILHGTQVSCTCGYLSTTRRSRSALNGTMAWHLGQAIADGLDVINGGAPPRGSNSAERGASLPATRTDPE